MSSSTFLPELRPRTRDDEEAKSLQVPDEDYTRNWLEAMYEEARYENLQTDEAKATMGYIDYLVGRQWPKGRSGAKSKPVDNRIWRLFWELVGLLTDVRPMFEIKALNKLYDGHAAIVNKATRSWWLEADADLSLAQCVVYALLNTAYAKLEWNPTLRNGEGDFDFIPISPNHCLPLKPTSSKLTSAQAVIYDKPMPLGWFRQKFGNKGWKVTADPGFSRFAAPGQAPAHLPGPLFEMLSPGMRQMIGKPATVQDSYYPMAQYREFWTMDNQVNTSNVEITMGPEGANWSYKVKPGMPLYPRGRLFCMGGPTLLHDGPNPYWHGRYPFEVLRMNTLPWQFEGASELTPLLPMQDIVNNILAGVMDAVKKAVNPPFIAPANAFSDAAWNAIDWSLPGAKAKYNAGSPHPPQWQPAPNVPAYVLAVMQLAAREMDASSGLASIAEAVRKKQVPSADTLESIKQTQQTPIRLKGRNMEVFLRRLGSMTISNIFQFYSTKRRLFLLGSDGLTFEDFDMDPGTMVPAGMRAEDHVRNFVFLIKPGTLLNIAQEQKAQYIIGLRKQGDVSRSTMYENLDIGIDGDLEKEKLKAEFQEKLEMQMKAQAAQGLLQAAGNAIGVGGGK